MIAMIAASCAGVTRPLRQRIAGREASRTALFVAAAVLDHTLQRLAERIGRGGPSPGVR